MEKNPKRIYVADDDEDILQILALMLQTKGYAVTTSRNAKEISTFNKKNSPDLVLLDIWMSGVDGADVCKELKENPQTSHIPVLFISANSDIQEITKLHHADGFIKKPFEMQDMLNTIQETLDAHEITT